MLAESQGRVGAGLEEPSSASSPGADRRGRSETHQSRAPDGRRFRQPYVFVVYFYLLRAWIEPVGSLLKAAQERM